MIQLHELTRCIPDQTQTKLDAVLFCKNRWMKKMTLSKGATGLMLIIIYILLQNKFFDNVPFQKSPLTPPVPHANVFWCCLNGLNSLNCLNGLNCLNCQKLYIPKKNLTTFFKYQGLTNPCMCVCKYILEKLVVMQKKFMTSTSFYA